MNKHKNAILLFSILSLGIFTGCATMFKGATEQIDITSDPSASKVYVNGNMVGKSPVQIKLQTNKTHQIEFVKEGYEKRTVILSGNVEAGWLILDFLAGVFPIIIDASTGSWYSFEENHIHTILEKNNRIIAPDDTVKQDTSVQLEQEYASSFELKLSSKESKPIFNGKASIIYVNSFSGASKISFKGIFGVSKKFSGPFDDTSIQVYRGETVYVQLTINLIYKVEIIQEVLGIMTLQFTRL